MLAGMTLVSAMAIQNAVHRVQLSDAPPTTLMTGSTTQIVLDVADLLHGLPADRAGAARARIGKLAASVLAFAAGCAAAAILYVTVHRWCFVVPSILALAGVLLHARTADGFANRSRQARPRALA